MDLLLRSALVFGFIVQIGCSWSPPSLEGARVELTSGDAHEAYYGLYKLDLIYQLDPKNYGFCHQQRANPSYEELDAPGKLRCALDGFYSYRYFRDIEEDQSASLSVSNIAFAFAERQAARIRKLAEEWEDVEQEESERYEFIYSNSEDSLRQGVIQSQVSRLIESTSVAHQNAPFLEFQRRERNKVQSAFLTATNVACDNYKRTLNRAFSNVNFGLGTASTFFGATGAVLTDPGTIRGLAGAAALLGGVRAEYNDAYFRNKVVEVLTKAIDNAQTKKMQEITRRQDYMIADYTMEDALNDAVLYLSECTLISGLEETSESLQTVADPGLKWLANSFGGAAGDKNLTQKLFESLGKAVGQVQEIQKKTEDVTAIVEEEVEPPVAPADGAASDSEN